MLQLRRVNGSMNDYVSNLNSSTPTTTLYHTLQRHNEILQDYSQEFNRTKVTITTYTYIASDQMSYILIYAIVVFTE